MHFAFCSFSKNKKLKGAKNSKEKIFLWAILMFLRLAFGKPHHDFLAMVKNQIGKFPRPSSSLCARTSALRAGVACAQNLLVRYFLDLTSLCKLHTIVCRRDTIGDQNETLDEKQGRTIEIVLYQLRPSFLYARDW